MPARAPHPRTANDRFKERFNTGFWIGLILATLLHAGLFVASPTFAITRPEATGGVTVLQGVAEPLIETPPPLPRPPAPRLVTTDVDELLTPLPPNMPGDGRFDLAPPAPAEGEGERAMIFAPYDIAPELTNPGEVQAALQRLYPPVLRDAGVEGDVGVWIHIDADGKVLESRVHQSSGFDAFDRAAVGVVNRMRFSPAYSREQRVPVWVSLNIRFEVE